MIRQSNSASLKLRTLAVVLFSALSFIANAEDIPAIDSDSDAVGTTSGEFNVDASGAAMYSIPIFAAPAPGGVAPQLALSYSSRGGHGPLGVGWGISGTSSIERCRKTKEHGDGAGPFPPVDFSANDVFCLDGQRLIQLATTSCPIVLSVAALAEFRTEIESFARICAYQTSPITNGPSHFTVERRDGSVAQYGFTADSRVEPNKLVDNVVTASTDVVMRWALNRTRQPTGAYIDYVYYENVAVPPETSGTIGVHLLRQVNFTGREGTSVTLNSKIVFGYGSMPDQGVRKDYFAGSIAHTKHRLVKIESFADANTLVRKYDLCYDDASSCFDIANPAGSGQRLPRMMAVQECANATPNVASATACRPATRFDWNLPSLDFADATVSETWPGLPLVDTRAGDFNGDGRSDELLWIQQGQAVRTTEPESTIVVLNKPMVRLGTAVSASNPLGLAAGTPHEFIAIDGGTCTGSGNICSSAITAVAAESRYHIFDFNSDGRDDLLVASSGNPGSSQIHLSTSTETELAPEI